MMEFTFLVIMGLVIAAFAYAFSKLILKTKNWNDDLTLNPTNELYPLKKKPAKYADTVRHSIKRTSAVAVKKTVKKTAKKTAKKTVKKPITGKNM